MEDAAGKQSRKLWESRDGFCPQVRLYPFVTMQVAALKRLGLFPSL